MSSSHRRRLPNDRRGVVHEFVLSGHRIVLSTGEYEGGALGEIFIQAETAGSTMSGLLDSFATAISIALQHETPFEVLADKFIGSRFEPNGFTGHPDIPFASSVFDYIFRFLAKHYAPASVEQEAAG